MDGSAHVNGPLCLYTVGHTVPAQSTLLSLLSSAMPDASAQPLLQNICDYVASVLAVGAEFVREMRLYGLNLLEAQSIAGLEFGE